MSSIDLIIDSKSKEVTIALLKDKQLTELHKEKPDNDYTVGDIYLGKVKKVVPSLNAAFVDVGYEKDAFLHYLDLGSQFNSMAKWVKGVTSGKIQQSSIAGFPTEPDIDKNGKINDRFSTTAHILVQIAKEPISSKGPRLTSEITLAGRYIVLVPFSNRISISQRIKNGKERDRLRRLLQSITPKNFGVIIRTVAENKKVVDLDSDLRGLVEKWEGLFQALKYNPKPPKKVLGELNRTSSLLRDILGPNFSSIHVNEPELCEEIKTYLRTISPDKEAIVKLHSGKQDIYERFGIQKQIKASFGKTVTLKTGSYLVIEHTEAMHVIDVNSGKRKSSDKDQEMNALETNLEVTSEIARQLRLRDMGGIIAIDFIDMYNRGNQRKLYDALKEAMRDDRAKHNVLMPSRFGVVEITRQRVRPETAVNTAEICPTCKGTGEIMASVLLTDEIENNIEYLSQELKLKSIELRCHPYVAAFLTIAKLWTPNRVKKWSKQYGIKITVVAFESFSFLEYLFYDSNTGKEVEF